jgi:hypothetical protein
MNFQPSALSMQVSMQVSIALKASRRMGYGGMSRNTQNLVRRRASPLGVTFSAAPHGEAL